MTIVTQGLSSKLTKYESHLANSIFSIEHFAPEAHASRVMYFHRENIARK